MSNTGLVGTVSSVGTVSIECTVSNEGRNGTVFGVRTIGNSNTGNTELYGPDAPKALEAM